MRIILRDMTATIYTVLNGISIQNKEEIENFSVLGSYCTLVYIMKEKMN